ncbi:thiamine pyrophosphate-dependent enzyme [Pandoraea terrae]|uniref:thiamine pyrophosphate-dependent enzyme n=1 Tax=Pandoraea terrae TaxID=1537710 RepID=UPI0021E5193B|nr:thiamine pyrophosphate-dependent enzyme [Pandoraea terrae]
MFEIRDRRRHSHDQDLLVVGGMGHASQIALGIAIVRPDRCVVCLDGDGALLMHMGGMTHCARADNFVHLVINNGAHDSVGGMPTAASSLDLSRIALACGYRQTYRVEDAKLLDAVLAGIFERRGSTFVEMVCRPGHRADLGRPTISPCMNKMHFMEAMQCATP